MNTLHVAVVPLDITWADVDENLYATERILRTLDKKIDLVVLPELFTTGFISSVDLLGKYAQKSENSHALNRIREWSSRFNFAIAGTMLMEENGSFYNRCFFVEPSGETTFYDKKHLFNLSSEARDFTPGEAQIPVVRYRGWNIAMAVCYEVRFPAWLRNNDEKYDLLVVPANWPVKRGYAWQHLLIARAIENQTYVVGANRSGTDDGGEYNGLSYIFNYIGKPIHQLANDGAGVLTAEFNREKLLNYRQNFPVSKDADKFRFITSDEQDNKPR